MLLEYFESSKEVDTIPYKTRRLLRLEESFPQNDPQNIKSIRFPVKFMSYTTLQNVKNY